MAKLYVKTDNNSNIIDGYSDFFRKPDDGDTCIMNDDIIIHFMIDGEINPPLSDENGLPVYKLVDGVPVRRTEEEITASITADK